MRRDFPPERLIRNSDRSLDPDACQQCGVLYSPQSDEDRCYHAEVHDEAVNGVSVPVERGGRVISRYHQFEIVQTDDLSLLESPASGERLKRASSIANEETRHDFGIFDEDELERGDVSLVWARETLSAEIQRIAGLAVVDSHVELGRIIAMTELALAISDQNFGVADVTHSDLRGIRFVWVLRKHRRTGLAASLVESAFAEFPGAWERIAFCYPFTPAGARLIYEIAKRASAQSILVYH